MAANAPDKRKIAFRLLHDGVEPGAPLDEPLDFGLPNIKGEVFAGVAGPGGVRIFDFALPVNEAADGRPVFSGAFAHGPAAGRFLYLGWKRRGAHEHPWGWRIKMPLRGLTWKQIHEAEKPGKCLAADVAGGRPHASAPVAWRVETL